MSSIDSLISGFEFVDIFAPTKYIKLSQNVDYFTYTLDDIVNIKDLRILEYTMGNYIVSVDWNPLNTRFKVILTQDDNIVRIADYYLKERSKFILDPKLIGSSLKILFYIDLDNEFRPMYIYKCYDLVEEVV